MSEPCKLNHPAGPCASCPWIVKNVATDIPNFDLQLAEKLAACCPDERDMGPEFGASMFACHQSKNGAEFACAGWLATVGHRHPGVRLAITMGRLDASAVEPAEGWPALHSNYQQVLEKLRETDPSAQEIQPL